MADLEPVSLLAGKWTSLVLLACMDRPVRFSELERALPDVSKRMLTQTLRRLEASGLLVRLAYAEVPPKVTYEATEVARELRQPLTELAAWAIRHRHRAGGRPT